MFFRGEIDEVNEPVFLILKEETMEEVEEEEEDEESKFLF